MTKSISEVFGPVEINKSVVTAKAELRSILASIFHGKSVVSYNSEIANAHACDFHRMLSEWSRSTHLDLAVRNIIISALYSSEVRIGGSGIIAAMLFCGGIDPEHHDVSPKNVRLQHITSLVNSWLPQGVASRISRELFQMGAAGCSVFLREGEQWGTVVKCLDGIVQKGNIDPIFAKSLSTNFSSDDRASVVAIDGIVESVGQIHSILENSLSRPVVIFARGFLPDVSNTLAVNYQQKKINCIPFVVEHWAVNNFLDFYKLGIACVSAESGDVITSVKLLEQIDVSLSHNEAVIASQNNGKRKITVELGRDLGSMRGLALDRIKTMLALIRFTIRTGFSTVTYDERTFYVPKSSYMAAIKTKESMDNSLCSLGAVIIDKKNKGRKNVTAKNKKHIRS